ncbi:glycoprotein Xg isoform X3 [Molossus molossus]|uniref:glycoprotein Xg isoform X3 n=1 Tax=Molossus molossus TaxID=27622 RepID=UPI0017477DAD|nr:glycoprotein Xg isoform X3 [Molossus molossus]
MEAAAGWRGLLWVAVLCFLTHVRGDLSLCFEDLQQMRPIISDNLLYGSLSDGGQKFCQQNTFRVTPNLALNPTSWHSGQGDFDLADALDPEPTKKPGSDVYPKPKPPYPPQPGSPDSGGNIYPRPKPVPPRPQPGYPEGGGYISDRDLDDGRYPPQPRPRPPAGGGGYNPGHDGYGSHDGSGHTTYGDSDGNLVTKIVSPIVSVVVVAVAGYAVRYCQQHRRRNGFRPNEPENV